jgi:hypothetical protein
MLTALHYLPYVIGTGLVALALLILFRTDEHKKRQFPQRIRQHYVWKDKNSRRD